MVSDSRTLQGTTSTTGSGGFTLLELTVAVVILAMGLLALAGTTAVVIRQTTLADVTTERAMALQSAVEFVRAQPYTALGDSAVDFPPFQVSWEVMSTGATSRLMRVITVGPGLESDGGVPRLTDEVADTFFFRRMSQ